MAFKERTRQFWFAVTDNKCAYEEYTERGGFKECGARAKQVHHIIGEAETLISGGDPERNIAIPLCENHHVRNENDVLGEPDSSFHPDIAQAFKYYKTWKQQEEHMKSITGRRTTNYSTSPFADVSQAHREAVKNGERYIAGDDGTDQHYIEKMNQRVLVYQAKTGESKPKTKPHPLTRKYEKPKKWYNYFYKDE